MATEQQKLLVISGSENDRGFLARCLDEAGYAVAIASDGDQGFELVQAQKPEVVLLDIHISGLSAEQIVQRIAEDEALRIIPVIVLAGELNAGDNFHAILPGSSYGRGNAGNRIVVGQSNTA